MRVHSKYVSALALAAVVSWGPAAPARAEEAPAGAAAEPAEVMLEEIVVKSAQPPRVDTMEVREVRETPARDLGEALDLVGGVGKVRKAGIANDVVLRGMKRDDVAVVIDGARVHGACPSRMDPPSFHLDYAEVDRVEVRRGPFDVTQAGGLGGVIQVHTRAPKPGPGTELNLGYGAGHAAESSAVVSYGGERADVMVGGSFKYAQPFTGGDGRAFTLAIPPTLPTPTGAPQTNGGRYRNAAGAQTAYDVRSGWAKVGLVPTEGQRLEVAYTRQQSSDVLYPYLTMDGQRDDTDRASATWRAGALGAPSRGLAEVYLSRVEHDMADLARCSASGDVAGCSGALPRDYSMRTLAKTLTWGGKVEGGLASELGELEAGADLSVRRWDNVTTRVLRLAPGQPYADEASVPDVRMTTVGFYAEARRDLAPSLRATAGARLDLVDSRARADRTSLYAVFHPGDDLSRTRSDVLPSGNVQLDWAARPDLAFFAGVGHGARAPDPQERYFALSGLAGKAAWVGTPSLRAVKNDEVDVGARLTRRGVLVKAQAFHAWLADYVTLADARAVTATGTLTAKTYRNVNARMWGGEASARVALPASLYASAGLGLVRGVNETQGGDLAEVPPFRGSLALRWDSGTFFAEAEEAYAARQNRVDLRLGEQPTAAWFVTNLRLGAEWRGLKAFAGVRNLFDKLYYEHLSYQRDPFASGVKVPEPGRVVYSNVQYAF